MTLAVKPGVRFDKLQPQAVLAALVVYSVYAEKSYTCLVTSGSDGKHMANSKHQVGLALDFRTHNISMQDLLGIIDKVKLNLGENYDVVLESDHLHVEYDPL